MTRMNAISTTETALGNVQYMPGIRADGTDVKIPGSLIAAAPPWIGDSVTLSPPTAASMTTVTTNSGTYTLNNKNRWLNIDMLGAGATDKNYAIGRAVPGSTWTMKALVSTAMLFQNFMAFGLYVRDSASGKIVAFTFAGNNNPTHRYMRWSAIGTFLSSVDASIFMVRPAPLWLQLVADASNYTFQVSMDGENWETVCVKSKTEYIPAQTDCGLWFGINEQSSNLAQSVHHFANIHHFSLA